VLLRCSADILPQFALGLALHFVLNHTCGVVLCCTGDVAHRCDPDVVVWRNSVLDSALLCSVVSVLRSVVAVVLCLGVH